MAKGNEQPERSKLQPAPFHLLDASHDPVDARTLARAFPGRSDLCPGNRQSRGHGPAEALRTRPRKTLQWVLDGNLEEERQRYRRLTAEVEGIKQGMLDERLTEIKFS